MEIRKEGGGGLGAELPVDTKDTCAALGNR